MKSICASRKSFFTTYSIFEQMEDEEMTMDLLQEHIRACRVCEEYLPLGPRPVVQLSARSGMIIISQAPGRKVHITGIPWDDASGATLRKWLGVDDNTFYNPEIFSIMPMGFCYPGKAPSGDMPPRPECAPLWHSGVLHQFKKPPLKILIGQYAIRYYLGRRAGKSLTETVKDFRAYLPEYFVLPHPSPRNQYWVQKNSWFMNDTIPELRKSVSNIIQRQKSKRL